jgi:hypothetical protein
LLNFRIIPMLLLLMLSTESFADCKTVKKTYEVTKDTKKCIYTTTWQAGWTNTTYHAEQISMWISLDCRGFAKPLKGKVLKTEILSETPTSSCSFKNPPVKTK